MKNINTIVIAGGGTAGWMTATALARILGSRIAITLVESDEIGIVGVGEATIPPIKIFNELINIDENEFLKATQGTFKLGIQFVDWWKKGHSYSHDFGPFGSDLGFISFYHYWLGQKAKGHQESLWDYNLNSRAIASNKMARIDSIKNTPLLGIVHAFHFDASLYAKFLRSVAEKSGVRRIQGKINEVLRDGESGNIVSLKLDSGANIEGDFFIDCTGFRGLLIEDTLKAGFEDFSKWLPVNRALAVPCESVSPLTPYTRSTAHQAGWQWRIPLQHRIGNGHVYCSDFISDDEASDILMKNLDGKPLADPRLIKFTTGRRKKFWSHNCVAIGLAGGFLEPLESTAIHIIQTSIVKLLALFPRSGENELLRNEYNRQITTEFDYVRDFIILHYHANQRDGEKFWDEMRHQEIPATLTEKIELFRESANLQNKEEDLFKITSWLQVMLGQGIIPKSYHPIVETVRQSDLDRFLSDIRNVQSAVAVSMPTHSEFIEKNCKATAM